MTNFDANNNAIPEMNIAIDLDKTIFVCNSVIYRVLNNLQVPDKPHKKLKYRPVSTHNKKNVGWAKFLHQIFDPSKYTEVDNAVEIINKLKTQENCNIFLLSSRPYQIKALRDMATAWLKEHDVKFTALIFGCKNKAKFCKMFNIDLLIDDTTQNCLHATSVGVNSINLIKSERAATRLREKHKGNNLLHVVSDWKGVDFMTRYVKYSLLKAPVDQPERQRLASDMFAQICTPNYREFLKHSRVFDELIFYFGDKEEHIKFSEATQQAVKKYFHTKK